jgi:ABC-type multidrug transport system ATPase subunit
LQVLKNFALSGKTVVCTIHQPSSEVFSLFDRILLMADGRTAFLGPVGDALPFFSDQGFPCPSNYNPAEFYIQNLATVPGKELESKEKRKRICDAYDASETSQRLLEIIKANRLPSASNKLINSTDKSPYKASLFDQFRAVLWRSVISVFRQPAVLKVKSFQIVVSLFFFIYLKCIIQKTLFLKVYFSHYHAHLSRADPRI